MKTYRYEPEQGAKKGTILSGFLSVFQGLGLARNEKKLWPFFIVPFLLNVIILTAIFAGSWLTVNPWLQGLVEGDAWYNNVAEAVISPVLAILLGIGTVFSYSILGNILIAPFSDFLSEKQEVILHGEDFDEPLSPMVLAKDVARAISNALRLVVAMLLINLVVLFFNLIPGIGSLIYSAISFLVTAFFMGFQFFDFPLERRRFTFREKRSILLKHFGSTVGVGIAFFLISFIPLFGFLGFNLGTLGATEEFTRYIKPRLKPEEKA
jgi:CysZ protein